MSAFPSAPLAHVFLCLYDTAVVFLEACQALVKYGLHVSERWRAAQAERVQLCPGLADWSSDLLTTTLPAAFVTCWRCAMKMLLSVMCGRNYRKDLIGGLRIH